MWFRHYSIPRGPQICMLEYFQLCMALICVNIRMCKRKLHHVSESTSRNHAQRCYWHRAVKLNDFALSNKFQSFTKMFVQKLKEIVNSFVSPFKLDSAVSWTPLSQTATKMDCFSGRKKVDAIFYLCKIDTVLSNYFCLPLNNDYFG